MSFIAEIGLSKIRPEERLRTSGAIENIDGVGATQARWVPVQNCNLGDASRKAVGSNWEQHFQRRIRTTPLEQGIDRIVAVLPTNGR
jgi:hypothetical protein